MPLAPGTRLGPYEIVSPLGAGGMGEVYRARDTRLDRTIAIKVLPSEFSSDPALKQRMEREARAISQLQHPHICVLHDIGSQSGTDFLVMEYLEGETLAQRLSKGALPLDQVYKIGMEIADALDKAHRAGITHRDLKPGNIMLTRSGSKLLDFGLAKAGGPAIEGAERSPMLSAAVTMTSPSPGQSPLTSAGSLVGTLQYMSPEQLQGQAADPRSDIFAFGAVLYEMATGQRAFQGKSQLGVASAILEQEPEPVGSARPGTPAAFEHLVMRCLAKDPEERWQNVRDVCEQLRWIAKVPQELPSQATAGSRSPWLLGAAAGVVLIAVAAFLGFWLKRIPSVPDLRAAINLPAGFLLDGENTTIALSPDGTRLAFTATGPDGPRRLWLRTLNGEEPQAVPGTEDATYPFWSPDGQHLGFFARRKLRTIDLATGKVQALCDASNGRGASWGSRGTIVFSPDYLSGLFAIPESGGSPTQLTKPEKAGVSHRVPYFLPDGKHLLFVSLPNDVNGSEEGVFVADIDSKQTQFVAPAAFQPSYCEPGFLLFVRGDNLMAQRFSKSTLRTSGEAAIIAEGISHTSSRAAGAYSAGGNRTLVYVKAAALGKVELGLFDGDGSRVGTVPTPQEFQSGYQVSPDGRRGALAVNDTSTSSSIWIFDLNGPGRRRLTFGKGTPSAPSWSPDGNQIAYTDDDGNVYVQAADGNSQARVVYRRGLPTTVSSWSRDGRLLALATQAQSGLDVEIVSIADQRMTPFLTSPAWEVQAAFSPDGNWMAYVSDETGRYEVYLVSFPSARNKVQLSFSGGNFPAWINGGRELAYVTPERKMVAVEVNRKGEQIEVGRSRPLFGGRTMPPTQTDDAFSLPYVAPDAKRLVLELPTTLAMPLPVEIQLNWSRNLESGR